jgi:hypothetical protein
MYVVFIRFNCSFDPPIFIILQFWFPYFKIRQFWSPIITNKNAKIIKMDVMMGSNPDSLTCVREFIIVLSFRLFIQKRISRYMFI